MAAGHCWLRFVLRFVLFFFDVVVDVPVVEVVDVVFPVLGQGCRLARCCARLVYGPDSAARGGPQVQFLKVVDMPVGVQRQGSRAQ